MKTVSERDYILCTHLARVRVMQSILRDIMATRSSGVTQKERTKVAAILGTWEKRMGEAITGEEIR